MVRHRQHDRRGDDGLLGLAVVASLLSALAFGAGLFASDHLAPGAIVHAGFFASLAVFLATLTGLLAYRARQNLEDGDRGVDDPPPERSETLGYPEKSRI